MRRNLLFKIIMLCASLLALRDSRAQDGFQFKSTLGEIKTAGFYKIILSPELVAKSKNELNDIRIIQDNGTQVPYVLQSDKPRFSERNFIAFRIMEIKKEADKQTHIVVENATNRAVNGLLLVIKNTDAERSITVSGSDDQKQWFVIRERIPLSNIFIQEQDRFVQAINFPNSSYRFFELTINGKDLLPVNIVKVGSYEGVLRTGSFVSVPQPVLVQKDSTDKRSYIRVSFKDNYLVDKLELAVTGPKFYRRPLVIVGNKNDNSAASEYVLSSGVDASYETSLRTSHITLVIDNQDSPPLTVQSVKAYQLNKYLLTYLEPATRYDLVFGNPNAKAPKYDLEFFKDSLSTAALEIQPGSVRETGVKVEPAEAENKNTWILWAIIGAVLVLLLVLTYRMTQEVSRKAKTENTES